MAVQDVQCAESGAAASCDEAIVAELIKGLDLQYNGICSCLRIYNITALIVFPLFICSFFQIIVDAK